MMLNVNHLFKTGVNMLSDNAPAILTAFGAVGVVSTAVLTGKATFEAAQRLTDADFVRKQEQGFEADPFTTVEKVKIVWPLYISAVSSGVLSCGAIVMSHRISSKRAAVLAAVYALNENKLEEYQDQIKEKFGVKKEGDARNELAQKRIDRDFDHNEVLLAEDDNKVLIREDYTGRFFWSTIEDVNRAVNEVNLELMRSKHRAIRMSEFHRRLGLSNVSLSDCMGWTTDEPLEIEWGTCTTPDGSQAVHTFEYSNRPVIDPERDANFR